MRVYLVQHGKSKSKQEDPDRSLTEEGVEEVTRMSDWLARMGVGLSAVRHSGKRRAQQTAAMLVQAIRGEPRLEEIEGLAPLDDPRILAESLQQISDDVMLVGHLPHLERLASLLLTDRVERRPVRFQNAGVVCLERGEEQSWSLVWAQTPDLVP